MSPSIRMNPDSQDSLQGKMIENAQKDKKKTTGKKFSLLERYQDLQTDQHSGKYQALWNPVLEYSDDLKCVCKRCLHEFILNYYYQIKDRFEEAVQIQKDKISPENIVEENRQDISAEKAKVKNDKEGSQESLQDKQISKNHELVSENPEKTSLPIENGKYDVLSLNILNFFSRKEKRSLYRNLVDKITELVYC